MPYTSVFSFNSFRSETVDLDSNDVSGARRSRDWLQNQVFQIAKNDNLMPRLAGKFMNFGSFARKTKVRPLDDVDLMIMLNGKDTQIEQDFGHTNRYRLKVTSQSAPNSYISDEEDYINSTVILNRLKKGIQSIPQYSNSSVKRNGVAVVLTLSSYDWNFDLVPTFPVGDSGGGTSFYIIPDGNGYWMRTDPRVDQSNVSGANAKQNFNLLPLIRLIKFWNSYSRVAPKLGSYYLETMLINEFKFGFPEIPNLRAGVPLAFKALNSQLLLPCQDPKGFDGDIANFVSWETKVKVREKALERAKWAEFALNYEGQNDNENAIYWWGMVFPGFPKYG